MKGNENMANLTLEEKVAKALFDVKAVKINVGEPFTFASGIKSPIYCDNRYVLGFSKERDTIVEAFVERIDKDVDVIVGVATAGIPWASFIADRMEKPLAYVRNKPKDHGAGNQIEGRVKTAQKMVVIEDLVSTGGSVLDAVSAAKREGADVLGVVAIFTYELPRAEKNFSDAGVRLVTLSNYTELIKLAEQEGYVSAEGLALLEKFKHDQENWHE